MEIEISKAKLKQCPSCKCAKMEETYQPMLYFDRFMSKWIVECRNCGMEILFGQIGDAANAAEWNTLPREAEAV